MLLFKRLLCGFVLLMSLSHCAFKPLYSSYEGEAVGLLASVKVANIEGRYGQIMRNALLNKLTPQGIPQRPEYILEVNMDFSERELGVAKDATATRSEVTLLVNYKLIDHKTGKVLYTGREMESADHNVLTHSYYSNIVSEDNTKEGTIELMSDLIKLSLSSYLTSQETS